MFSIHSKALEIGAAVSATGSPSMLTHHLCSRYAPNRPSGVAFDSAVGIYHRLFTVSGISWRKSSAREAGKKRCVGASAK